MADIKLTLKPGRYFAGVDIPFFVPNDSIRSAIADLGGTNIAITDREHVESACAATSEDFGHHHLICATDLQQPSQPARAFETSEEKDHTHTVNLSREQLTALHEGKTVNVRTSEAKNHTHSAALRKLLPFDPRKDPKYSDSWEEVVTADYHGPTKTIETPRRWKWLMVIAAPSSSTPGTTSDTPSILDIVTSSSRPKAVERSSSGALLVGLGVAAVAGVGVLLWRRARRG